MWRAIKSVSQKSAVNALGNTSATPDCLEITQGTPNCAASNAERPNG